MSAAESPTVTEISVDDVTFVKELYPRMKPSDAAIERYRAAIGLLPPITVARGRILVDGFHRWQAHRRESVSTISAVDLGDLSDIEILKEAYRRNRSHGHQLETSDKKRGADDLYRRGVRDMAEVADLIGVTANTAKEYCRDARRDEKQQQQDAAWNLWLDCRTQQSIADELDVPQPTISKWLSDFQSVGKWIEPPGATMAEPWGHIQHFDVWQFQSADKDAGQQSYFGALPPQVIENLLWFWTEPGEIIIDPFAGSGTTVDVAKAMGRRVWASDIRGAHYSPHLPIHEHDITAGWPDSAPRKADLVVLDPPYWQQASGRYSSEPGEMAEMNLEAFYATWVAVTKTVMDHAARAAYIISPTQLEDGRVIDHATDMLAPFHANGWRVERRVIVPYQTQQATGQQVTWARENRRLLKLYRDLVVLSR